MRLFIAINFNDEIKAELISAIENLKRICVHGNFTRKENLHQTLVFIGETPQNKLTAIKKIMDDRIVNIDYIDRPLSLTLDALGKFKRSGGDIYWVGVKSNPLIAELYDGLCDDLENAGFNIEKRKYKPHITIGREVIVNSEPEFKIRKLSMNVAKISLMKSERINGKLKYTEVYGKNII